jgi:hypothetical protein
MLALRGTMIAVDETVAPVLDPGRGRAAVRISMRLLSIALGFSG